MSGFCTAPSRARAISTMADSMIVGSCQLTAVPSLTPRPYRKAAARSAESRHSAAVSERPSVSDTSTTRQASRRHARSSSPHRVAGKSGRRAHGVRAKAGRTSRPNSSRARRWDS